MSNLSLPADLKELKRLTKPSSLSKRKNYVRGGTGKNQVINAFGASVTTTETQENDLTNYVRMIQKQAKQKYDEVKETETPQYSEFPYEILITHPIKTPKSADRVLVLVLVSVTFFVQMFSRDIWIPFFEPALIAFPKWSQTSLALIPIWNNMNVILMIPACVVINKYGIKTTTLCSLMASIFGTGVRCLPFIGNSTILVHVSAVFLSSASVVVKPLAVTISTCCFLTGERNLATGCLTSLSMVGSAVGLLTTIVLRESSLSFPVGPSTSNVIMYTMYSCFAVNVVCALLVYVSFPQESPSERYESLASKQKFLPNKSSLMQSLFKNKGLFFVALSYACSNALSWPWYQMLDVTYFRMGFPQEVGLDCRFWMIVNTCLLTLSICWFADRRVSSNKRVGLVCQFLASAFLLLVVSILIIKRFRQNSTYLVTGVMFAFPLSWTTQSLMYELAADNAFTLPENMAVGFIESLKVVCESSIYVMMAFFPKFHLYWMHVFTFCGGFLSFVFLALLKEKSYSRF